MASFRNSAVSMLALAIGFVLPGYAQRPVLTDAEKAISAQISSLRKTPDDQRGQLTKDLALQIRALPVSLNRLNLASGLSNLATEGDCGKETLQTVADTLAQAIQDSSSAARPDHYSSLARLERYEGVKVKLEHPQYQAAMKAFEERDRARNSATFRLADLNGKTWSLEQLKGKVVLLNFWATWCPPCRKEMPDMDRLQARFKDKGLVVLAVSDEEPAVVRKYISEHPYSFAVLLDPGRVVNDAYQVQGIPQTVIYNRDGRIAAIAVDQRTEAQFLEMLAKAGLK